MQESVNKYAGMAVKGTVEGEKPGHKKEGSAEGSLGNAEREWVTQQW